MSQPYNEDDVAWAREMLARDLATAVDVAQKFVDACRDNKPLFAAHMVKQLHGAPDPSMLMLVIGQLTMRVVSTERRAAEAHGPLLTAQEIGKTPEQMKPLPFQTATTDQMQAALEEKDFEMYARIMVDGMIQSVLSGIDQGEPLIWEDVVRANMLVSQENLTLAASDMLVRMVKQELERRQA